MTTAEVRARLVMLETMRLVVGRQGPDGKPPRRVYDLMDGWRRTAEVAGERA